MVKVMILCLKDKYTEIGRILAPHDLQLKKAYLKKVEERLPIQVYMATLSTTRPVKQITAKRTARTIGRISGNDFERASCRMSRC